jgi:hypothetical protein
VICTTERYYFDFIVRFREAATGKEVFFVKVLEKKEMIGKKIMDEAQLALYDKLDRVEQTLFSHAVLIEKSALDLLSGDFSSYR